MTHEDVFLQDIIENHQDDTPRRIYADWLLDHPDPVRVARGEFIHLQCDLARCPPGPPRPEHLLERERRLLEAHAREWGSPFQRLGCVCWEYRRGFVEGVGLSASAFLSQAAVLFRSTPLHEVKLYDTAARMADLAGSAWLARVRVLDLEKNDLGDAEVALLAGSPHLAALERLHLWSNRLGDDG